MIATNLTSTELAAVDAADEALTDRIAAIEPLIPGGVVRREFAEYHGTVVALAWVAGKHEDILHWLTDLDGNLIGKFHAHSVGVRLEAQREFGRVRSA